MKAIFISRTENARKYNRETRGWEFLGTAKDERGFYNKIHNWENRDFFEQEDGTVTNQNSDEVFNPEEPDTFNFYDYEYRLLDVEDLTEDQIHAVAISGNIDAEDVLAVVPAFDIYFNSDESSDNEGFKMTIADAKGYIETHNGTNKGYFADYKGGTVSVVNAYTEETVFETEVK